MPGPPALVEAGGHEGGDRTAEIWAAEEGDMDPGCIGAQKGEEGEDRGVRAGTGGAVVVEGEVELETAVLAQCCVEGC